MIEWTQVFGIDSRCIAEYVRHLTRHLTPVSKGLRQLLSRSLNLHGTDLSPVLRREVPKGRISYLTCFVVDVFVPRRASETRAYVDHFFSLLNVQYFGCVIHSSSAMIVKLIRVEQICLAQWTSF